MNCFKVVNCSRQPFPDSAGPESFFEIPRHTQYLAKLLSAMQGSQGGAVVLGDEGAAKTTLSLQLAKQFADDPAYRVISFSASDFSDASGFLVKLSGLLEPGHSGKKTLLLIIDEAQQLPVSCLRSLDEFCAGRSNGQRLQLVFFARRDFLTKIASFNNLAGRLALKITIKPLSFREIRGLLGYYLRKAGRKAGVSSLFTGPALWNLRKITGGNPKRILELSQLIILALIIRNRPRADRYLVHQCGRQIYPDRVTKIRRAGLAGFAGLMIAFILLGFEIKRYQPPQSVHLSRPHVVVKKTPLKKQYVAPPANKEEKQTAVIELPENAEKMMPASPASPPEQLVAPTASFEDKTTQLPEAVPLLGKIFVFEEETLGDMIRRIYGPYSFIPSNIKRVLEVNPQLGDPDMLAVGDVVRFPVIPVHLTNEAEHVWWLRLITLDSLQAAYRFLRIYNGRTPPLLIIPTRNGVGAFRFSIFLQRFFIDKKSVLKAYRELPATLFPSKAMVDGISKKHYCFTTATMSAPVAAVLGELTVQAGDTMGAMIRNIYGPYSFTSTTLQKVMRINPGIDDPNRLKLGETVRFPAIPVNLPPRAQDLWWVQVAKADSLPGIYKLFRKYKDKMPRLLLVPVRTGQDTQKFILVLEEYFTDENAAHRRIEALPPGIFQDRLMVKGLSVSQKPELDK